MSWSQHLGEMSLNISFLIYLIVYLPQITHNRKLNNIKDLSLGLHVLLYMGYLLDLFYGFAHNLPWQYKVVSSVGCVCLFTQQLQLIRYTFVVRNFNLLKTNLLFLFVPLGLIGYFFYNQPFDFSENFISALGYSSRFCFLTYLLPQLIKNYRLQTSNAISLSFISLNCLLSFLDLISSWCLHWGWPNQIGAPVMMLLMLILFRQQRSTPP